MTTRDEAQQAARERLSARERAAEREPLTELDRVAERERPPRPATTALPERLLAARERKGVDLYRAERDTKIRARYLAALERGDYSELPGAVYTKGFLRNYALYLGLDPDEVLLQWRRERGERASPEAVIAVPRPIHTPRTGLVFTPGIFVAAILTLGVVAFIGYLGIQLFRFAQPPTISVTQPRTAVLEVDEGRAEYTLRGTSLPGATIEITTPGREPLQVAAGATGQWAATVQLRRGENRFVVSATDPETGKEAEQPVHVILNVPFSVVQAPTLTVASPAEGASYENGAIPVEGTTTNAATVTVRASYVGPTSVPAGTATPPPPPEPEPRTADVATDGSFSLPFELTEGRWQITVSATSAQDKTTTITRAVSVQYSGVNLVVSVKGGRAWLKVWVDGKIEPTLGAAGKVFSNGKTLTFTAERSIEVRTGSSGVTHFTLNGTALGALGKSGVPETWLFEPPGPPTKTTRS